MAGNSRRAAEFATNDGELGFVGELTIPKQKRDLFKSRVFNKIADLITAVYEPSGCAVDEANRAGYRDDSFESRF